MLLTHAERHQLRLWRDWAECFGGLLAVREGQVEAGLHTMRAVLERGGDSRLLPRYMILQREFAAGLGEAGDAEAGLRTIDGLIGRCEESGGGGGRCEHGPP
jgi:hypothetical protein